MAASIRQLRNKRLVHNISKVDLAREMGCSYAWTDVLDRGAYVGPAVAEWTPRYSAALDKLIARKGGAHAEGPPE